MNRKLLKYAFIFIFILQGCGMNANKSVRLSQKSAVNQDFKTLAIKKFGEPVQILPSPDDTYILYMAEKKEQQLNPNELVSFFVVDKKENKIVYEDAISGVSVSWKSDSELWLKTQKGIISSPTDDGKVIYYYDLKKKEKIEYNKAFENTKPN
ncbi:MAG: hypothetical protein CVU09_16480 [Bacteroidetes bacterium HGW-Bacteroidetes-4]|jgi:hypothetical protein|nr:MAG: hypothetical protein CVU09_16480 [Bacteroidetes bacterium HGW-Bacteroidetes-4]